MLSVGDVFRGLIFGSLAGINSLGIVLLWRTTRLVNLAQPSMGLVGGVLTGLLIVSGKWNFWLAVPVGLGMGALLGLAADRIVLRRLREAPRAVLLVATVAFAQICGAIQSALPFAFGGTLPTYTLYQDFHVTIGTTVLQAADVLALVALPLMLAASLWFLHRSRFGLAALALGQDAERAQSLGIPAAVVRSTVWAFAGLISTVSGILSIPVQGYSLGGRLAPTILMFALAPAVLAGMRSLTGAAVAALGLGILYQWAFVFTESGPESELLLAAAVVIGVALQGRQFGRGEAATRASSWEAAATPRPLPWSVATSPSFKMITMIFAIIAVGAATLPPRFLGPGHDGDFAIYATFALGAIAVSVAWMFAGEVALGHWGIAGLTGILVVFMPGPWALRCALGALSAGVITAVLGSATRRRSSLSFAVVGLAAAAAAEIAGTLTGDRVVGAPVETVGRVAAAAAVLAVIGVTWLRSSKVGVGLVAARDDPDRALWLGVAPLRSRVIALGVSGALVGLGGALCASSLAVALSAGAGSGAKSIFSMATSLDLLGMAVIGGLGSPVGVLIAAILVTGLRLLLPDWGDLLASGLGILLVLIFLPGGLGRLVTVVRDLIARVFVRTPSEPPARASAPEAVRA